MSGSKYTYDSECQDLAEHFLAHEKHIDKDVFDLAQDIQDAVEIWFAVRAPHPLSAARSKSP